MMLRTALSVEAASVVVIAAAAAPRLPPRAASLVSFSGRSIARREQLVKAGGRVLVEARAPRCAAASRRRILLSSSRQSIASRAVPEEGPDPPSPDDLDDIPLTPGNLWGAFDARLYDVGWDVPWGGRTLAFGLGGWLLSFVTIGLSLPIGAQFAGVHVRPLACLLARGLGGGEIGSSLRPPPTLSGPRRSPPSPPPP